MLLLNHYDAYLRRLIILAGTAQNVIASKSPGNHVFDVFDTIPLIPL
jgi:hypothetical protein